jgi:hypothetical protein
MWRCNDGLHESVLKAFFEYFYSPMLIQF